MHGTFSCDGSFSCDGTIVVNTICVMVDCRCIIVRTFGCGSGYVVGALCGCCHS